MVRFKHWIEFNRAITVGKGFGALDAGEPIECDYSHGLESVLATANWMVDNVSGSVGGLQYAVYQGTSRAKAVKVHESSVFRV